MQLYYDWLKCIDTEKSHQYLSVKYIITISE